MYLTAAYRRQVRLHTGENLDDSVLIAGSEKSDPFLAKLDEAYRLLSNPLKRWTHDEELKEAQLVPLTEEELEVARKRIEPPDAWLSYQRPGNTAGSTCAWAGRRISRRFTTRSTRPFRSRGAPIMRGSMNGA